MLESDAERIETDYWEEYEPVDDDVEPYDCDCDICTGNLTE